MNKIHLYKNGLALAYAEYGSPDGRPILAQHGLIASLADGAIFQKLVASGARVICAARPGYGASSPYTLANLGEWGELCAGLADELGLARFDVLGMSSGAPFAYAVAARLAGRVRNLYIFSGMPALYVDEILAAWPYGSARGASQAEMQKVAFEVFFAGLAAEDLEKPDIKDSMANDCFGVAQELRLRCNDWGFTLAQVRQPVFMRHSRRDGAVPALTAELTARLLPDCRLELLDSEIHFSQDTLDDFFETVIVPRLAEEPAAGCAV